MGLPENFISSIIEVTTSQANFDNLRTKGEVSIFFPTRTKDLEVDQPAIVSIQNDENQFVPAVVTSVTPRGHRGLGYVVSFRRVEE